MKTTLLYSSNVQRRLALFVAVCLLAPAAMAASPLAITVDANSPGAPVSDRFSGLSYEMALVLPGTNGSYFFSPNNKPLITMFQTLGLKVLRVGGNTADRPGINVPGPADIDSLFAFAKAADVKVIFTLRLRQSNPEDAVKVAKYVMDHYQPQLICFAIGNEPNVFDKTYSAYHDDLIKYMSAILAVAPDAKFGGPSTTPGKATWVRQFAGEFAHNPHVVMVTQHDYPGGAARTATNTVSGRDRMLSAAWVKYNERFYESIALAAMSNGLPFRLEEANSFYNGGAKDVSDTFASALWALDYQCWWASKGCDGINFHTGDTVAAGEKNTPCRYASFWTASDGYTAHPIAYAVKAFNLGAAGRIVPANIINTDNINLTAYGVLAPDGSLYVTLINKEHDAGARGAAVTINAGDSRAGGYIMRLTSPQGNVAATTGTTLGDGAIADDGSWDGSWTPLAAPAAGGRFTIDLPATSAAVIRLTSQ